MLEINIAVLGGGESRDVHTLKMHCSIPPITSNASKSFFLTYQRNSLTQEKTHNTLCQFLNQPHTPEVNRGAQGCEAKPEVPGHGRGTHLCQHRKFKKRRQQQSMPFKVPGQANIVFFTQFPMIFTHFRVNRFSHTFHSFSSDLFHGLWSDFHSLSLTSN